MIAAVIDETPLYLPVEAAARRSGIAPALIAALTDYDPRVEPCPVRSERGRSGRLLVHLPDVMLMAGALEDSGLLAKYGGPS